VHLTGFAAVVSVHITILSAPVKHTSLTDAVPPLSVVFPLQGAPEDIENPPIGPHELIVVGGTGGCGATCKHPAAINPAIATPAINLPTIPLANIPLIRPPPAICFMTIDSNRRSMLSFYPPAAIMSRLLMHPARMKWRVVGREGARGHE
jgi:hypothetical protein